MKKVFITLFLFLSILKINSQNMKSDTIKLPHKLVLYQKNTTTKDKITWKLLLDKKDKGTVELDEEIVENNPFMGNDFSLYEPDLIDAFIDNNCLYAFVYKGRRLFLYEFDFIDNSTKFNKRSQRITDVSLGSVDNFGGFKFNVQKYIINEKRYFHLNYGRDVGGKNNMLLVLEKGNIKRLVFSELNYKIKDKEEILKTLDLEENVDKINIIIKNVLIQNNFLHKTSDFKYLGNIDITSFKELGTRVLGGITYFFYKDKPSLSINKIIRYDNNINEWLLCDYKEEEIKKPTNSE